MTIDSKITLTNRGTVNNEGSFINNGIIKNYGNITGTQPGGEVFNSSQVTVSFTKSDNNALDIANTAIVGDTVNIVATVGLKTNNYNNRSIPSVDTVDFYLNNVEDNNKININPVKVENGKAILPVELTGDRWDNGYKVIYAVYGGSSNLFDSQGSGVLIIKDIIDKGITINTEAPINGRPILNGSNLPPNDSYFSYVTWSNNQGISWGAFGNFMPLTTYQSKYIYVASNYYLFDETITASDITVTNKGTVANVSLNKERTELTVIVTWPKTDPNVLLGKVTISGTLKYNETLTATLLEDNNTGDLSYRWKRGNEVVGTNSSTYTTVQEDIGKTLTCEVTSSIESGKVIGTTTTTIAKQDGAEEPSVDFSFDGSNLNKLIGSTTAMEYSIDGGATYHDCTDNNMDLTSSILGITADNDIRVRIKETETTKVSDIKVIDIIEGLNVSEVSSENCTTIENNDGKLKGVSVEMEYKKSTESIWTPGTGNDINNLTHGIYNVRNKATGKALAGTAQDFVVEECILIGISVKTAPNKINYTEGEIFDPTGLVLTMHHNNGPNREIAYNNNTMGDFTFSPSTALTTTDNTITITYNGNTTIQTITVGMNDKNKMLLAKPLANFAIDRIVVSNDTTESSILNSVSKEIASVNGALVSWKANSFVMTKATDSEPGSIVGTIILTIGTEKVEISVNKMIEKLPKKDNSTSAWEEETICQWYDCNKTTDNKKQSQSTNIVDKKVEDTKPTISLDSTSSTYQAGEDKDMTMTLTGKKEDIEGIYIDNNLVDASNYIFDMDGTVLTLKSSYLDNLSKGVHTLSVQYKNNISAEIDFTIVIKDDQTPTTDIEPTATPSVEVAQKPNSNNALLFGSAVVLVVGGLGVLFIRKRRLAKK